MCTIHTIKIEGAKQFGRTQVLASRPGLIIDTCASGGRRIDLEILERAVALWFTDYSFTVPARARPFLVEK